MKLKIILLSILIYPSLMLGQDYYFVADNNGRWSDIQNWRTTSGGTIQHSTIPASSNDVFIDENSFPGSVKEITIDLSLATCHNITISTTKTFTFRVNDNSTLTIAGNVSGHANTSFDIRGDLALDGPGMKSIDFGRQIRANRLTIDDSDGEWTIQNDFYIENELHIKNGMVSFQDLRISAGQAIFDPSTSLQASFRDVEMVLRSTDKRIRYAYSNDYTLQFLNAGYMTISSVNSSIRIAGDYPSIMLTGNGFIDWDQLYLTANEYSTINFDNIPYDANGFRINSVAISGNARIFSQLDVDRIRIEPGSSVELVSGGVFQWNNILARGTCDDQISINSGIATITTQNTEIEHAVLINIQFSGPATATQTSLAGSTSGITVNQSQSNTYYWVRGNGNWSDITHWSLSSGGPSAGCIPSGKDDVVFDGNSFDNPDDTVGISENVYVNDIRWEIPVMGNMINLEMSSNLYINGSMIMSQAALLSNKGSIHFISSEDQVIDTKDSEINGVIIINGEGSWTMHSDFNSLETLNLKSGSLILNGFRLRNNRFQSNVIRERTLDISNSHWVFEINAGYPPNSSEIASEGFNLRAESSHTFIRKNGWFYLLNPTRMDVPPMAFDSLTVMVSETTLFTYENAKINAKYVNLDAGVNFGGDFDFEEVLFSQGHAYKCIEQVNMKATEVHVQTNCPASLLLYATKESSPALLDFPQDTEMPGLTAKNIHMSSGSIRAIGGLDNGNNQGIDFDEEPGRTLYWVDGTGYWHENAHWSLSSGGPGGECPPGPADNAIFDNRSFSSSGEQAINLGPGMAACHDLTWTAGTLSDNFYVGTPLHIFGSVHLEKRLTTNNTGIFYFLSEEEEDFYFKGSSVNAINFLGSGTFDIQEDISTYVATYDNGHLTIFQSTIACTYFYMGRDIDQPLNLNNSIIRMDHPSGLCRFLVQNHQNPVGIENTGNSYIEFLGITNQLTMTNPVHMGTFYFRNPDGDNHIFTNVNAGQVAFSYLEANGDNTFRGHFEMDTLIIHPGHHLLFDRDTRIKVNDLYRYAGNNCLSSTWRNLAPVPGEINFEVEANTVVLQDHIQMTGITASSPVDLFAGPNSTNLNNSNTGWIFDDQMSGNEENGILGPDLAFCGHVDSLTLNENNIFNAENITWNETVADPEFLVTEVGEYRVRVAYSSGCELYDTLNVNLLDEINLDLGEDKVLCEGDSVTLSSVATGSNYEVAWNTGSHSGDITIRTPGFYKVSVSSQQCEISDSVRVEVLPVPDLHLASLVDTARCEGNPIELDLSHLGNAVVWQGDTVRGPIMIHNSGRYHARVIAGSCFDEDEINITFYPPPDYDIQQPTPVCEGESIDLIVYSPSNSIRWQDGNEEFQRTVTPLSSRSYAFELRSSVCTLEDSVRVTVHPAPVTNLLYEKDFLCKDEELLLEASSTGDRLEWSDGSAGDTLRVNQPGRYFVKGYLGPCRDSMGLDIERIEQVDLGLPADTLICDDEAVLLSSSISPLEDILWNGAPGPGESSFSGDQMVVLQALYRGCPVRDSTMIRTRKCGPSEIVLPNAFSPNGDGQNDAYLPVYDPGITIHEYQMLVFDRWGNMIFSTTSPGESWTGRESDKAPHGLEGVYGVVLEMKYTNSSDRTYVYEGSADVIVVR